MKPATIKYLHSAGGVIYRLNLKKEPEVALIAVKNKKLWTLPKGMIDKGEDVSVAAIREVQEETGLIGNIIDDLGESSYWFYQKEKNIKYKKTVHYFLMKHVGGEINKDCSEVDDVQWVSFKEAFDMLFYKSDKVIMEKAHSIVSASNNNDRDGNIT